MKNRLKKVMMESETSVDELAKSLNCSYGIVKYLQDGKTDLLNKLTGKEIERLAKYFHTNPAYLVGWSDDPSPIKEKKQRDDIAIAWDKAKIEEVEDDE